MDLCILILKWANEAIVPSRALEQLGLSLGHHWELNWLNKYSKKMLSKARMLCEKSRRFGDDYFNHVPFPPFPEPQGITRRSRLGKAKSRAIWLIQCRVNTLESCEFPWFLLAAGVFVGSNIKWHRNPSTKGWFPPCRDEWLPTEENDFFFFLSSPQ